MEEAKEQLEEQSEHEGQEPGSEASQSSETEATIDSQTEALAAADSEMKETESEAEASAEAVAEMSGDDAEAPEAGAEADAATATEEVETADIASEAEGSASELEVPTAAEAIAESESEAEQDFAGEPEGVDADESAAESDAEMQDEGDGDLEAEPEEGEADSEDDGAEPEPDEAEPAEMVADEVAEVEADASEPGEMADEAAADVPPEFAQAPVDQSLLEAVTEEVGMGQLQAAEEATAETEEAVAAAAEEPDDGRLWYVVHCYSGYENKVRHNLEQRIETMNMKGKIFDVVVPTEEEMEVRDGKRRTVERRVFPGYILVQMLMDEDSWYVVRNTPGVTGFVGMGNDPTPLRPEEVNQIIRRMEAEAPRIKVTYKIGQKVRIIDGPFNDFIGTVDDIDMDKAKVRVMVSFFGRETPVELDFLQVEKA